MFGRSSASAGQALAAQMFTKAVARTNCTRNPSRQLPLVRPMSSPSTASCLVHVGDHKSPVSTRVGRCIPANRFVGRSATGCRLGAISNTWCVAFSPARRFGVKRLASRSGLAGPAKGRAARGNLARSTAPRARSIGAAIPGPTIVMFCSTRAECGGRLSASVLCACANRLPVSFALCDQPQFRGSRSSHFQQTT